MKILIFSRRRHYRYRLSITTKIFGNAEDYIYGSDEYNVEHLTVDFLWLKNYIDKNKRQHKYKVDYDDLIERCRYLRNISKQKAINIIDQTIVAYEKLLLSNKIDIIYSIPIDSYVIHCLHIVATQNQIKFFSFVGTFIKDRIRITNFGELVENTEAKIEKELIQKFIDEVESTSIRPEWLIGVSGNLYKTIFKRYLIDSIKPLAFSIYRMRYNDFNSFSFPSVKFLKKRMFATFSRLKAAIIMEKTSLDPNLIDNFVFIPLQFYPEITSDYWIRNRTLCNHHEVVLKVIDSFNGKKNIVVKEHPAAFGRRDDEFLSELFKRSNVYFAPVKYPMNSLINKADLVIGNASTTTVNAIILKKPVIFFSKPYFNIPSPSYFKSLEKNHLIKTIKDYDKNILNDRQIFQLIEDLYRGSAEGNLGGYKPIGENSNVGDILCTDDTRQYVYNYLKLS